MDIRQLHYVVRKDAIRYDNRNIFRYCKIRTACYVQKLLVFRSLFTSTYIRNIIRLVLGGLKSDLIGDERQILDSQMRYKLNSCCEYE